jgi:drug/metabolite transporter (DMT)-like permease
MNIQDKIKGYLYVTLSATSFSIMVIIVKYLQETSIMPATQIAFFRFLVSFLILVSIIITTKKNIRPKSIRNVLERGFGNAIASITFFVVIAMISATKANLYNMTYPIFVAIIAHFYIKERLNIYSTISVIVGFAGVITIINPSSISSIAPSDFLGLTSGILAGYSVVALKKARTTDHSFTILFYHMLIGITLSALLTIGRFVMPTTQQIYLLILIGLLSYVGQYTITYGYKFVSSLEGAIISLSRIFIVAILGILFLTESLTIPIIIGGGLIAVSILLLNVKE